MHVYTETGIFSYRGIPQVMDRAVKEGVTALLDNDLRLCFPEEGFPKHQLVFGWAAAAASSRGRRSWPAVNAMVLNAVHEPT